jgi:hypothetical protein
MLLFYVISIILSIQITDLLVNIIYVAIGYMVTLFILFIRWIFIFFLDCSFAGV